MHIHWLLKRFDELTPYQLYAALQLRSTVFVVEQNCVYLDADDKDQNSYHLLGFADNKLVAYTRIVPAGVMYQEPSIGRVVTAPGVRRTGVGRQLMQQSIKSVYNLFNNVPIRIGAQLYLQEFYASFGFQQISDVYLEDGIEHIYMLLPAYP
ncbi:MAG: GNAT family N-acetyltransferase [Flavisolibacter sp.]|nr:GNAT family N-acetyltransferase [Flavisolibacter sp.]